MSYLKWIASFEWSCEFFYHNTILYFIFSIIQRVTRSRHRVTLWPRVNVPTLSGIACALATTHSKFTTYQTIVLIHCMYYLIFKLPRQNILLYFCLPKNIIKLKVIAIYSLGKLQIRAIWVYESSWVELQRVGWGGGWKCCPFKILYYVLHKKRWLKQK